MLRVTNLVGFAAKSCPSFTLEEVQSLPAMTSNTGPSGHVASAKSQFNTSTFGAFQAFAQNGNTGAWNSANGNSWPQWLQRKVPTPIRLWAIELSPRDGYPHQCPSAFILSAGTGAGSLVDIGSWTTSWLTEDTQRFELPDISELYDTFRIPVTATAAGSGGPGYVCIGEMALLQAI